MIVRVRDIVEAIKIERQEVETSYKVLTENYRAARTITDKLLSELIRSSEYDSISNVRELSSKR